MSKFKRLTLNESMEVFPLMNEEARRKLKGGCSMCDEFPGQVISVADYERMDADGTWTGGFVCGIGYIGPTTDIWGERDYCFNHGVYTDEEDCMGCYYEQFEFCGNHNRYYDGFESCDECMSEYYENYPEEEYDPYKYTGETGGDTDDNSNNHGQNDDHIINNNDNTQDSTHNDPPDKKPLYKSDISLMDRKKFTGYSATEDCLAGAKKIMDNYNCAYGNSAEVFQLGIEEDGIYGNYGENPRENYQNAIDCIDRHLDNGRPIIVGVDYTEGSPNVDGTTDHFVVIVGRGYDKEKGMYYYTFMDTGTDNSAIGCNENNNRFYYDAENLEFECTTIGKYTNGMRVAQVRPNDGKSKGMTIDSNHLKK